MAQGSLAQHYDVLEQVQAIRRNDETALQQLYLANYSKVESFVLNNNGSTDQAKDVFQEAFIAVWRNIQLNRFEPKNNTALDGYLYQIAKNKWMDYLRSNHHTKLVRMENITVAGETDDMMEEEESYLQAIKKHFATLGDNCRKILTMYYYENESLRTIADTMGWTEPTAKNNKYRCIQKLRELVNQQS